MTKMVVSIEDDPQIADLIRLLLAAEEVKVHHYTNGEEGLKGVIEHQPDLVLLDVMIPGMSGWEVHQKIREHEAIKNTPVMILSVTQQTLEQRLSFKNSKVDFYMSKPFEVLDLRQKVNEILQVEHWQLEGKLPDTTAAARTQIKPIRDLLLAAKKVEEAKRQAQQQQAALNTPPPQPAAPTPDPITEKRPTPPSA